MSLFQCENCGVVENTALSFQGIKPMPEGFDFTGIEHRKGKMLCSECAPEKFTDGSSTGLGKWHGRFKKLALPFGMFKTNMQGNLEHIENGDTDYRKYELSPINTEDKRV